MLKITKDILKKVYPPRKPGSKKYDHGLLLVVGGGEFYTGSPALAAMAAFRAGVDMVQVLAPQRAADVIAGFSPNLAALPFLGKRFDAEDLSTLKSMTQAAKTVAKEKTAVVIGGGLGRSQDTRQTVLDYLRDLSVKSVIDADGIHAVSEDTAVIQDKPCILTPHAFEFYVLTKQRVDDLGLEEKAGVVRTVAARLGCVIVLKGQKDIISDGKEVAVNETGNSYLTTGGTGDTLAGIAGALLAKGVALFTAACGAAYINGMAGEIASKKWREGTLATDLIDEIPNSIKH